MDVAEDIKVCRKCVVEPAVEAGLCPGCLLRAWKALQRLEARRQALTPVMAPAPLEDPILEVAEVAERLRVDPSTVYRLIRAGRLRAVEIGRRRVVRASAFARFVLENRTRRVG